MSQLMAGQIEVKTPVGKLLVAGGWTHGLGGLMRKPIMDADANTHFIEGEPMPGFIKGKVLSKTDTDFSGLKNLRDADVTLSYGTPPRISFVLHDAFSDGKIEINTDTGEFDLEIFGNGEIIK